MGKKQNYSYVGISLIILLFGIIFIPKIINRIEKNEVVDIDRHNLVRKNDGQEMVTIGKVPEFRFVNQNNDTITNATYRGKVYVVEFFFTTCPSICPIMSQNMLLVEKEYLKNPNVGFASITINPEYDTPEVLKTYAQTYGMTHRNWHLMTGERSKIYELANKGFNLYVGEAPEVEGGFEHSGYFALIDQEGNIRSRKDVNGNPMIYYDGLEKSNIQMLIEDIETLLKS